MNARDAVIECFRHHPGQSLRVRDVRAWVDENVDGEWKDIGTTLADLTINGNNSSKYRPEEKFLERVVKGTYRVARDPTNRAGSDPVQPRRRSAKKTRMDQLREHIDPEDVRRVLSDPSFVSTSRIKSYMILSEQGQPVSLRDLCLEVAPELGRPHTHQVAEVLMEQGFTLHLLQWTDSHEYLRPYVDEGFLIVEAEVPFGQEGRRDEGRKRRKRALREVAERPGQGEFRRRLLKAYGGRCALTGADRPAALQAAHIRPVKDHGTDAVSNGLLLRADVHALFDAMELAFDERTGHVLLSPALASSALGQTLVGLRLVTPKRTKHRPSPSLLREHRLAADLHPPAG